MALAVAENGASIRNLGVLNWDAAIVHPKHGLMLNHA